jgi:hypothetical protein
MHLLLLQETTTMMVLRQRKRRLIKTIPLIIPVFHTIQMPIYSLFLLENPHTLMERITHFGVIKCVVIYFLSILAFTVLLASLYRDEYNKVSGLDNAKQIWDTLKISHEANDATMITKMELVEDELGRFAMIRGEEPTQTYNRLKTLVNKIRSYGSTRWTDHDVVRLMLMSFTVIDPHLVNLIRENPRYTKMTPEEILGKFVSGRMMVKEARYVDDASNGPLPIYEPQPDALKATSNKEPLPSKVTQVEAAGLNKDEMVLIIKRFKTALKGHKEYPHRNKKRENAHASNAVRLVTLLQIVPIMIVTRDKRRAGRRRKRRTTGRQKARRTLERNGTRTAPLPTPTTKDLLPQPSTNPHSSPTNTYMSYGQGEKGMCLGHTQVHFI